MKFNWISPKLATAECDLGKGQFATQHIVRGELLVVWGGGVMTLHEFDLLPPTLQHFPYQIGENPDLLFGPFNAEDVGDGDYFNHSCNPNAGFRGTQMLVAMKAIATGQQVTFDYAICMTGAFGDMPCQCGDRNCRQFISGNDWKIPSLQRAYRGYWQPYIQEKIDALRLPRRMKSR